MHSLAVLHDLPAGYFVEESPGGILAVGVNWAPVLHELGFGPEQDGPLSPSDLAGRRPLYELRAGQERLLVRRFHHGGLLRWITRTRFRRAERPFHELILANALQKSGLPTAEVVAARARVLAVGGYTLDLVTRRIEGTRDLAVFLEQVRAGEIGAAERFATFRAVGSLLRQMHRVGFLHADLQPRNILVRSGSGGEPELWILDLDGSCFVEELSDPERRANLRRLFRAARRREDRGRPFLRRTDYMRFLDGYHAGGAGARDDWREIDTAHRRRRLFHSAGWALERTFGGGPESRDGGAVVRDPDAGPAD